MAKKGGRIFLPFHPRSALLQKVKHSCGKNSERRRRRRRFPTKHLRYAISHISRNGNSRLPLPFLSFAGFGGKTNSNPVFPIRRGLLHFLERLSAFGRRGGSRCIGGKKVGFFLKAKLNFLVGEVLRFSKKNPEFAISHVPDSRWLKCPGDRKGGGRKKKTSSRYDLSPDIQDHLLTSNSPCPLGGIYMKPQDPSREGRTLQIADWRIEKDVWAIDQKTVRVCILYRKSEIYPAMGSRLRTCGWMGKSFFSGSINELFFAMYRMSLFS